MAKRPSVTDTSFLAHIFSPKKAAKPTGLRKGKALKVTSGRKSARVSSYNKLTAVQQEILNRAGLRESYLRGETTLAEAKRTLRPQAVSAGVAKPTRQRGQQIRRTITPLDIMVRNHFARTMREANRPVNPITITKEFEYLDEPSEEMLGWEYGEFKYAGRTGSEYEVFVDGQKHNPFWYH